jgi:hypothetical protein
LVFSADGVALSDDRIPVSAIIGEPGIVVDADPIQLSPWSYSEEWSQPLTAKANKFAAGSKLTLVFENELPTGVELALNPSPWVLAEGENDASIVVRWTGPARPPRGFLCSGSVTLCTEKPDLIIRNASIPVELKVPLVSTSELTLAVVLGSVFAIAVVVLWFHCPLELEGTLVLESLGRAKLYDDTSTFGVDDTIHLNGYGTRRLLLGADDRCHLRIAPGDGCYAAFRRNRKGTFLVRIRDGSKPITFLPSDEPESEISVEPGHKRQLKHGDRLRVQSVTLRYEDI